MGKDEIRVLTPNLESRFKGTALIEISRVIDTRDSVFSDLLAETAFLENVSDYKMRTHC